ncbi:MAG: hypothetical protein FDZ75_00135 [Actinobacteria bacterium]|nr:MAG: hypothetical protein FDZ75_00135 [Actinomycetota bacterium]
MKITAPGRAERTYTQHLVAAPAEVFPLLCPVREAEWLERWDPTSVFSASGAAERDCVFVTASEPDDAIWYVTQHDPEPGFLEMLKITPRVTACRLTIELAETPEGCDATVTYRHTSLGPAGDEFVSAFTEEYYEEFMRDWGRRLNHYLTTGEMLLTR